MHHLWPLAVTYWDACDYARKGMQRHYENRCQMAQALAAIGNGSVSHPQFNPGNADMVRAIHATGPNWRVQSLNSEVGYKLVLEIAANDAQALALIALLMEGDNPL